MWGLRFLGRAADRLRGNLAAASGLFDSYRLPVWPRSRGAAPRAALPGLARLLPRVTWPAGARALQAVRDYRADTPLRDQRLIVLILCLGAACAAGGLFAIQTYSGARAAAEFEAPAARFTATLTEAIDDHLRVAEAAGDLFEGYGQADRWAFYDFAAETQSRLPGIQTLEWIPRVWEGERRAYEGRARLDGLAEFGFREDTVGRGLVRAQTRAEYYPVYYFEPFEGHEAALGVDLATDAAEWQAFARARDDGAMVAAPVPAAAAQAGAAHELAVIQPVYRTEVAPFTVEQRREQLLGFVRATLRLSDLVEAALPGLTAPPGLDIYLIDQEAAPGGRLLHYHPSPLRHRDSTPLSAVDVTQGLYSAVAHEVAGRTWSIVVRPVPSHVTQIVTSASWGFAALMLVLTMVLTKYLIVSQTRAREARRSVEALLAEIRRRHAVENELRGAVEQAELANRAKSEFLAMMSHELRTPLNAVIGFADVMKDELFGPLGSDHYRDYSADIRASGEHLLNLINDILDLSKIEAKSFELHEESLDVAKAWDSVQTILREKIATAGLRVQARIPKRLPLLRADERAFRQILINLLSNAVKFTPAGGTVTIGAQIDGEGRFVLQVADSGIGIAQEDLEAVFEPFKQVDGSLARKYEGTGLGLPLCKRLVELHGGRLAIESEPGTGTTVTILFGAQRIVARPRNRKRRARADNVVEFNRPAAPDAPARRKAG